MTTSPFCFNSIIELSLNVTNVENLFDIYVWVIEAI